MKEEEKIIITSNSVMGALAKWAVRQSPYHRPENLEIVLDKFYALIKGELDDTPSKYIKKFDSWKELYVWLESRLKSIPEFLLWNERKNGNQAPYGFSSRYDSPEPDNDFIDLDALIRNIANESIDEY